MMRNIRTAMLLLAASAVLSCKGGEDLTQYVNPFIGTTFNGHTFPGATVPFGLVQPSPQTGNYDWQHCGGYRNDEDIIFGFGQTHLSGTGCSDLGDILIMPYSVVENPDYSSSFDKSSECAIPGYYSVDLTGNKVKVEMTATERTAHYRLTYGESSRKLFVDFQDGLVGGVNSLHNRVKDCELSFEDSKTITGHLEVSHWVRRHYYFAMKFDTAVVDTVSCYADPRHKAPRYVLSFADGSKPVQVKIAMSTVSVDGAKASMAAEDPKWDFDGIRKAANKAWNNQLALISVKGNNDQKTNVYTSIYHLSIQPNVISDLDGQYRTTGGKVMKSETGRRYSTLSLWDTFRAAHPFYSLFMPERNRDFVVSMLEQFDAQGFLPIWELMGIDNFCMIGNHAVPVVVDAVLRGEPGIDPERAYKAVKTSLTVNHINSAWDIYDKYGYYPYDLIPNESVSRTLEHGVDDYCAAQLARKLGYEEDYEFFMKRAAYYRNLVDPVTSLPRARDSKGAWRTPFSPVALAHEESCGGDYTEGNAWQYAWHSQHDVDGLIEAMGGSDKFTALLDELFTTEASVEETGVVSDVTGLIGQYAHGNEPSHHVIYYYTLVGRQDKAAELVRKVFDQFYLNKPDGLCGNDDCGQMSAWYLFSAMGFYPVNTISQEYVLGAPQIPEMTVALPNGKTFTMVARNLSEENKYVESVTFNGEPLDKTITSDQILSGGTLEFVMRAE